MHAAKVSRSIVMKVGAVDVENEETIEEVSDILLVWTVALHALTG